jgi:hypothetical protein
MKSLVLFLACFVFSGILFAEDHHGEMKECHKQMKELCKDKKRGPELFQCMEENKSKLSADCQKKIEEKKEKWANHAGPCKADREKLCADVKPGGGRIRDCMKAKMAELSPECKANIEKMKAEHGAE